MIRYTPRQLAFRVLFDVLMIWLSLAIASFLRISIPVGMNVEQWHLETPPALFVIAPIVWILGLHLGQVYNTSRNQTLQIELVNLALGHGGAALLFCGILYITFRDYSRLQTFYLIVVSFILLALRRIVYDRLTRHVDVQAVEMTRVLIVGTDETARRMGGVVATRQPGRLELIGYVAHMNDDAPDDPLNAPILGTTEALTEVVDRYHVDELVVTIKWFDQETSALIGRILKAVESFSVNVRLAPDYSDVAYFHTSAETFYGMPLIGIREPVFTPYERVMKRLIDLALSALALVVCLPLFALIAVAIRLDSPGPVLLAQERVGFRGRKFLMYKFRSMLYTPNGGPPDHPYNLVKVRDDPRITRVGRILRRTSLDELPQFFNVLIGDMSVVGPRPEIPEMVSQYEWWQRKRFEVPQGMTGWWQINGRADRPMHYHTSDDLFYIRNYSLWLDLWIIVRTLFAVVFGRGAY